MQPSECDFEITDRERKALKWIMLGIAHREIYDCMFALPMNLASGSQNASLGPGKYQCPEAFSLNCPVCENQQGRPYLARHTFTPQTLDVPMNALSGILRCDGCRNKTYKLWFTEAQRVNPHSQWRQAWVNEKPGLPILPVEVDDEQYQELYREILQVLPFSSRAAAVLSRYCLQRILRDQTKVTSGSLASECKQASSLISDPRLTAMLRACLEVGNWAAHPDSIAGSLDFLSVEPGEVETLLRTVRDFLNYYFVLPKQDKDFFDSINAKRRQAGKAELDFSTGKSIKPDSAE